MGSGEQPEPRQRLPTPSQADHPQHTQTGLSLSESRAWHYCQAGRRENEAVRTFPSVLRIPCHKEMEIRSIWDTDRQAATDVSYTISYVTNLYSLTTNKNPVQIKSQRFSLEVNFSSGQPGKLSFVPKKS